MSARPDRNREVRSFGVLRESPALHFHLLQLVGFVYLAYRFASRNYTVYGLLPSEDFDFPRTYLNEFLPVPAVWLTTFQFVYAWIPRPSPDVIQALQYAVVGACALGVLGILPRAMAWIAFLLATHMTGFLQSSNADVDGGCLALALMLILALSPGRSFYSWRNGLHPTARDVDHHWPVFLLFLVAGCFYAFSGLNKLVEIGLDWPVSVHLDHLAEVGIEQSLLLCGRYRAPGVAEHVTWPVSLAGGFISLIGEIGFLSILWLPRYRPFFVATMVTMHVLVFLLQGINFLGSSFVLLLCLDWNAPVRRATVLYDEDCGFCIRWIERLRALDAFGRLDFRSIASSADTGVDRAALERAMGLVDENGEVYFGADAFEQAATRTPLLWPFALAMKVPGAIYVARAAYAWVARNRGRLACEIAP